LETARAAGSATSPNSFRRCYGSSYIAADLTKWLDGQNMEHVRGAPYHPMTQGKIERWHQTLKNRILLENGPRNFLASVCIVAVLVCWV
jgi:transposase InsO family protein